MSVSRSSVFLLKACVLTYSLSLLTACQPTTVPAAQGLPQASSKPASNPTSTQTPGKSPSPVASNSPTSGIPGPILAPQPTPTPLPGGIQAIRIIATRTSFSAPGQQTQLKAMLLDSQGREASTGLSIEWASSHPQDFSVNASGLVTVLKQGGSSEITARIVGTDLIARLALGFESSSNSTSGGGGGGGGGGVGVTPVLAPTPSESASAEPTPSPSPDTREFRANTYTSGGQTHPKIAVDANGNFVVVWQSFGQDGDGEGIYAQRFNASGQALGDEFRVNQTTAGNQTKPDVAMTAAGNIAMTWQSNDGSDSNVYGRFYSNTGAAASDEFVVNNTRTGDQSEPKVSAYGSNTIFSWASDVGDDSQEGIYARAYTDTGMPLANEFRVNQTTSGTQFAPDVSLSAAGALITWTSHGQSGGESFDVFARRFSLTGGSSGDEFRVNATTSSQEWISSAALHDSGSFAIAWHAADGDGDGDGVYSRFYDAAGLSSGPDLQVNQTALGHQSQASVSVLNASNYVVIWMSMNQDGDDAGVFARHLAGGSSQANAERQLNISTAGAQNYPAIASSAGGLNLVYAWASEGLDGDSYGIAAGIATQE